MEINEIISQLQQLRYGNRHINLVNLELIDKIKEQRDLINQYNQERNLLQNNILNQSEKAVVDLNTEKQTLNDKRLKRRKAILQQINNISDENKTLEKDINDLKKEINSVKILFKINELKNLQNDQ